MDQTGATAIGAGTGRQHRRRYAAAWLAVVAALVLAVSCSAETTDDAAGGPSGTDVAPVDEGPPQYGGQLVFGLEAEPDSLDPVNGQFAFPSMLIASSMLETLAVFDQDRNVVPYLAESIEPRDLAIRWTITLRPGIQFSDGTPLNAESVAAGLEAQRGGIGAINMQPIEAITVTGDLELEVEMNQPWASFPSTLTGQNGLLVSPASLENPDPAAAPSGTGPFVFDTWEKGSSISVRKNDNYWREGEPYLDSLEYRILTDPSSRSSALVAGDVDLITMDDPDILNELLADPDLKAIIDESGDAVQVFMNQAQAPFDNPDAREALVLGTDSPAVAEAMGGGSLTPIDQPFPPDSPYHQDDPGYPDYDPDGAKAAVARYTDATGQPLTFTLMVFTGEANLKLAQLLQEQWSEVGIEVQINAVEQASAITDLITGNFQAGISANFGYPDPDVNFLFWHSSFSAPLGAISINFPHYENEELDASLTEGRVNLVPEKRYEAYQAAVRKLNEDNVYVWLYRNRVGIVAHQWVHGLAAAEGTVFSTISTKPWIGGLWVSQ